MKLVQQGVIEMKETIALGQCGKESVFNVLTNEHLININKTLLKQRDELDVKVSMLTTLIDDVLWGELSIETKAIAIAEMKKINV